MLRRACVLLSGLLACSAAFGYPQYYDFSDRDAAQREARERNLPLAWLGGSKVWMNESNPDIGGVGDLQQMALNALQGNAVIVFFDGNDISQIPPQVHAQFHIHDDTNLGVYDWREPKIVFANPETTKFLGRVSETQMDSGRASSIYIALQAIREDSTALQIPPPPPPPAGGSDFGGWDRVERG